ncbi:MAG: DEAD/DEAH box helicase [Chloroflexota bacterium]|nr:DEAD/DEAH box helicase [Chloroflexota bacterium]
MTLGHPPEAPVPVRGCFVVHLNGGYKDTIGVVLGNKTVGQAVLVEVSWGSEQVRDWHSPAELGSGFLPGCIVQDAPVSNTKRSLGTGLVLNTRHIASRDQVLVQLHNTGESKWLPYENLLCVRQRHNEEPDSPNRFRLKALAHSLDSWNQITGALDRLDVDPLPHQIDLVHRIMTSDQSNWLIADDVGLGKTIEVGLLLAAKKRRRLARRVMVVSPASVVRQWQDEMQYKFNEDFRIYGLDFHINHPSHWAGYDKVIVSIDRAKTENHCPIISESGTWDLIIFDEAHHLSKIEGQAVTQRYRLAETLRKLTDEFVFLTGTPHQGDSEQFVNLLRLLRPDLTRRLTTMFTNPSVVAEVVLRNRKSLVTDVDGNFLFRGQDTRRVEISLSEAAKEFDLRLQTYLKEGYAASEAGGTTGRAIGFVMTIYRKLASSSIYAIEQALQRRLSRLNSDSNSSNSFYDDLESVCGRDFDEDAFIEGIDAQDDLAQATQTSSVPFFTGEESYIAQLLDTAAAVKNDDRKLMQFLSEIVDPLQEVGEKVLIFTEYRATQDYLVHALQERYSGTSVAQINGGMSLNEKRNSINSFNEHAQFLVSTEAGGEGINLHQNCHIMVNYDLPWNPGRLVQRSGRLYRYGQSQRVIVFNLMAVDGFDNLTISRMLERVNQIAEDMHPVSSEFRDGLHDEIIGAFLERIDMSSILATNRDMDMARTNAEIDEALARAKESQSQQEILFADVEGYNPDSIALFQKFGPDEVIAFLRGILPYRSIRLRQEMYSGRVLELELPAEMRGSYSEFPLRATVVRVSADRSLAAQRPDIALMDFASAFFAELIEFAKSPSFGGESATFGGPVPGVLNLYKVRWQDDQGVPKWEALLPTFLPDGSNKAIPYADFFRTLLLDERDKATSLASDTFANQMTRRLLDECADNELASQCTALRHPNDTVLLASATLTA